MHISTKLNNRFNHDKKALLSISINPIKIVMIEEKNIISFNQQKTDN